VALHHMLIMGMCVYIAKTKKKEIKNEVVDLSHA
jgi:hypothetical protein